MLNELSARLYKISPNLRKFIGNTSWLVGEKIIRMGLSLVVGVWVARYLAPDSYGILNYAIAFVFLFEPIAQLGLPQIAVRDLIRDPVHRDLILGTAFTLKLLGGLAILPISQIAIHILRPNDGLAHSLVAIVSLGIIFKSFEVIDFWFQSQVQSRYTVCAKTVSFTLSNLLKVLLILLKAPLILFVAVFASEMFFDSLGMIVAYRWSKQSITSWRFSLSCARSLLADSWPLIFSSLMIALYMQIDQIMLGQMVGAHEVGIYAAASRVSGMWYFIPGAIVTSVAPSIIEAKQIDAVLYNKRLQKLFSILVILSYIAAIFVVLTSSHLVILLLGKGYLESASILIIHIWTGVFVSLGIAANLWVTTEGLMRWSLIVTLIGVITNSLLNYLLIPELSGEGAAIATLISQFIASCGAYAFIPQTRVLFFKQVKSLFNPLSSIR